MEVRRLKEAERVEWRAAVVSALILCALAVAVFVAAAALTVP